MKYEVYNHYTDSVVGYAESLESAMQIADGRTMSGIRLWVDSMV